MDIKFFCPLWGCEEVAFEVFCERVSSAGYDGVEMLLPEGKGAFESVLQTVEEFNLGLIAVHAETLDPDVERHLVEYRGRLEWIASSRPIFINSHTGRDWFSFEENQRLLDVARQVSAESGVKIIHETHRGRFSFCAATARRFLEANSDLRLVGDFSHWCTVSESLLKDQQDSVEIAIDRVDHIHSRVGHIQGPQVSDPRAPEWADALNAHLAWWDSIVDLHVGRGTALTVTPEFGAFPYMPELPYTCQPVVDQWEINVYMMNLLKKRYVNPRVGKPVGVKSELSGQ